MNKIISRVSEDDQEIIEATLNGCKDAFGELVEKYQQRLYGSIVHLFGVRDAEDIVQETFLKAFKQLRKFRGTSEFYSWLYRIGYNTAVDYYKSRKRAISLDDFEENTGTHILGNEQGPDEAMEEKDRVRQLQIALDALRQEHRTIIVLREKESLSYGAIADLLSIPAGTIRSRLHRARMCLLEELKRVMRNDLE
ncbi:MAG: sigma-70 family RNA polymerase sigma factor [Pirellulales bacterium]|nr:sigma-70 family RNA polymerase sigma factor [Pirellulales bacterium]